MRESRFGIITSVALHTCVALVLVAASFAVEHRSGRVVEVDFSLVRNEPRGFPVSEVKKRTGGRKPGITGEGTASRERSGSARAPQEHPESLPPKGQGEPPSTPTIVTEWELHGETAVHGVAGSHSDLSGNVTSSRSQGGDGGSNGMSGDGAGGGSGGGQGGRRGSGHGPGEGLIEGGRDYNYIRDAVMKNIRYPDEAIKLGIEGKVLLSFIVLEDGTTSRIKVVAGSGCRLLDEGAKEAVAMTRINRKVPYRVVVHLPITYKLQG